MASGVQPGPAFKEKAASMVSCSQRLARLVQLIAHWHGLFGQGFLSEKFMRTISGHPFHQGLARKLLTRPPIESL
jgi:hypothetical protein